MTFNSKQNSEYARKLVQCPVYTSYTNYNYYNGIHVITSCYMGQPGQHYDRLPLLSLDCQTTSQPWSINFTYDNFKNVVM